MSELEKILADLISFPSITPEDQGCQAYMIGFLQKLGFTCQEMNQGPVTNFFASYGTIGPLLVFAGHTDVVPVGERSKWQSDPFVLTGKDDLLYGRGVADMKGSLACMLVMAKRFISTHAKFQGRLGFLITSGEEGDLYDFGTPYVMEQLEKQGIQIDYCIVGEPTSTHHVGDVIKIGRRGSLSAKINIHGIQGHVAYPHLAENPIHKMSPVLAELTSSHWDEGNAFFPPTSMQITHIHSGGHSNNVIPGEFSMDLNFRYSTEQTEDSLKERVINSFKRHKIKPEIEWRLSGEPYLTDKGLLLEKAKQAVIEETGEFPELSTSGGTSDARFIAPYGVEVVEMGPVNASIHKVNECVCLGDLEILERIYFSVSEKILIGPK